MREKLKACPFCGSKEVYLRALIGDEGYVVQCPKCGSKGTWSEDEAKCIALWNKRAYEMFAPKSKVSSLAPRMYELLKEYCGIVEEFVSIYDNFPEELQEVASKANELIYEADTEEEEDE